MEWAEVVEHPILRDLPFKIELDKRGQIIMNPVKIGHSLFQGRISFLLQTMRPEGLVMAECAIKTRQGTKAADVAWASMGRVKVIHKEADASIAPEVCVEVVSMSNTKSEMAKKRKLYFEQGAQEVWVCDEYGKVSFYNPAGELALSVLFPDFPARVELNIPA